VQGGSRAECCLGSLFFRRHEPHRISRTLTCFPRACIRVRPDRRARVPGCRRGPEFSATLTPQRLQHSNRGASRISADFYGKAGPFGLILAGFGPFRLRLAKYGVLLWRTGQNVRHVFRPAATFHAINRPFILGVRMASNAPTCDCPDWPFTDFTITPIWRACCYSKFLQRSGKHPEYQSPRCGIVQGTGRGRPVSSIATNVKVAWVT
jgi:hypothetical protein